MKQLNKVTPFEFDCVPSHVKEIHMIHIPETKFFLGIPHWKEFLTKEELSLPALDYSVCTSLFYLSSIFLNCYYKI